MDNFSDGDRPVRTAGRVALTGAGGVLSASLAAALAKDPSVAQLLVVDPVPSGLPLPGVEMRPMDVRDRLLPLALDGVDTIVHCAFDEDLAASPDALFGHNVGGTRNLLAAADKADVRRLVVVSSALAYGAHADNPLPLHEDQSLRANPDLAFAFQRQLVEDLVERWAQQHPSATTCVLRCGRLLHADADDTIARWLLAPLLIVPEGSAAPWQFVAVEDVVAAVLATLRTQARGPLNVATDGWLSVEDLAGLLHRRVQRVGETTLQAAMRALHPLGLGVPPPETLALLQHPVVLDTTGLQELGWRTSTNQRELVRGFAEANRGRVAFGPVRTTVADLRRRATIAAVAVLGAIVRARRRRRART